MAKKLGDIVKKNLGMSTKKEKTSLLGAVGAKVFGKSKSDSGKAQPSKVTPNLNEDLNKPQEQMGDDIGILAKNSMAFHSMSRDFNLIRQNIIKITKDMGLKPSQGADMHMLKESERGAKLGVEREKAGAARESKKPTPAAQKPQKEKGGKSNMWMMLLKTLTNPDVLILAVYSGLKIAEWFTELWDDMVSGFNEWIVEGKLWTVIGDKISTFVDFVKETFTLENLMKIVEDPGKYIRMMWDSVTGFFGSMGDFISEKFDSVKEFFGFPVQQKAKNAESPKPGKEPVTSGLSDTEAQQARADAAASDPRRTDKPKVYSKEEIAAAEEAERKAQYTGQDEIVRERMGLKGPSSAEMRGEVKPSTPEKVSAPGTSSTSKPEKIPSVSVSGDDKSVMAMIKKHEGVRNEPYKDSVGLWTVGVGHLIGDGRSLPPEWNRKFTDQEIDALFAQDYQHHKAMATKTPGWDMANDKGRAAMVDLAFNMGGSWFKRFKNAAAALASGDFNKAADELTDSVWYQQVKGRAATVTQLIREGKGKATTPSPAPVPQTSQTASLTTAKPSSAKPSGSLSSAVSVQSGVDISNFNASLEDRVLTMANAFKEQTGKKLLVTSGYRDNAKQKELWDKALAKNGGDAVLTRKMVAEPMPPLGNGKGSQHAKGLAIDINSKGADGLNALAGPRDKPTGWLEKFGLTRPIPGEDWHVQIAGTTPVSDNPDNPGKPTLVADKSGNAVDINSGKKENMPATQISQSSTEVASGQRRQVAEASQPVIINNTTTVNNSNIVAAAKKPSSGGSTYSSSAALTTRIA